MLFSFVTLLTNPELYNNFKKSLLRDFSNPEELEFIPVDNTQNIYSAAGGLNKGIELSSGKYIALCHQDILCENNWLNKVIKTINLLDQLDPYWGVLGMAGVTFQIRNGEVRYCAAGAVNDFQAMGGAVYCPSQTVDELCMIIRQDSNLRFDEHTLNHFHYYGADMCLSALARGMQNYTLMVPTHHLSDGSDNLSRHYTEFRNQARRLYTKWFEKFPCFSTSTTFFGFGAIRYHIADRDKLEPRTDSIGLPYLKKGEEILKLRRNYNVLNEGGITLSVVLVDSNLHRPLGEVLSLYAEQSESPDNFEVIIISSNREKLESVRHTTTPFKLKLCLAREENFSAFKNEGIKNSSGNLILFTSTAASPTPSFIYEHIERHIFEYSPSTAVLGGVKPDPNKRQSPLQNYLARHCREFPFFKIPKGKTGAEYFNPYNISFKKSFLAGEKFNTAYTSESLEGRELTLKLEKKGLNIVFTEKAQVYYSPAESYLDTALNMYKLGKMTRLFAIQNPGELDLKPVTNNPEISAVRLENEIKQCLEADIESIERIVTSSPAHERAVNDLYALYERLMYANYCKGIIDNSNLSKN